MASLSLIRELAS
ncbi:hypothetical protein CPC698_0606A, partial [Chlamydia psittaci C6/98]